MYENHGGMEAELEKVKQQIEVLPKSVAHRKAESDLVTQNMGIVTDFIQTRVVV